MNLPNNLVKQFASVINQNESSSPPNKTVYGTAYRTDDGYSVMLDGSTIRTPASTTMDIADGDRVAVLEKDHKLIITGNVTKPADQAGPIADLALTNAQTAMENLDDFDEAIHGELEIITEAIEVRRNELEEFKADIGPLNTYIKIDDDSVNPSITVALNDDNRLELLGNRVSIYTNTNETVYMANDRMVAPSAVITNLYMQTTDPTTNEVIGQIGWVMRSNAHLSLKGMW